MSRQCPNALSLLPAVPLDSSRTASLLLHSPAAAAGAFCSCATAASAEPAPLVDSDSQQLTGMTRLRVNPAAFKVALTSFQLEGEMVPLD